MANTLLHKNSLFTLVVFLLVFYSRRPILYRAALYCQSSQAFSPALCNASLRAGGAGVGGCVLLRHTAVFFRLNC
ncbi:MAG TPA: hypothetical protein DF774_07670 [Rheinheimera sp.]|nr:hypothetical protein [Rheinheimera sp.]